MTTPQKHRTTGVYYFRKGIPEDVRQHFGGKRELKVSLRTKKLPEAKRLIGQHITDAEEQIALARAKDAGGQTLSSRDLAILADGWLRDTWARVEATDAYRDYVHVTSLVNKATGRSYNEYETMLHLEGLDVASDEKKARVFQQQIDNLLQRHRLAVPFGSKSYLDLARMFCDKYLELERLCIDRIQDDFTSNPKLMAIDPALPTGSTSNARKGGEITLNQLFEQFKEERLALDSSGSVRKTLDETELQLGRFVSAFGDKEVAAVSKRDMREFRTILAGLPKVQRRDIKNLPVREQLAFAEREGLQTLAQSSVRKNFRLLSPLFTYAVELDLIDGNPADGIKFTKASSRGQSIQAKDYTAEDITKVFKQRLFTKSIAELPFGRACYWVPILAYYTGARVQEITQLLTSDIQRRDGIYYLSVTTEGDEQKTVKNDSSFRDIPLHPHLIQLGLVEFVAKLGSKKALFSALKHDKYGKNSAGLSKWFGKQVRELLPPERRSIQPFHAFRHTFKTMLRDLGISEDVSDSITGHTDGSVSRNYGRFTLKAKLDAISKIPSLDLKKLG